MRMQRRPFMVEVKRGTTRSAFTVKDTMPEIMRKAEAVLFRHAQTQIPVSELRQSGPVTGRILPSIIEDRSEPEVLVSDSYDPPKRRGRPVGSKNKPKTVTLPEDYSTTLSAAPRGIPDDSAIPIEPKRRGRPPGSRNKPKLTQIVPTVPKKVRLAIREAGVDVEEHDTESTMGMDDILTVTETAAQGAAFQQTQEPTSKVQKRTRLRDRSKILSRYVWGTQPLLGEGRSKSRWSRAD